jgi:hypothetical protein
MTTTSSFPNYGINFDELETSLETFSAVEHAEKLIRKLISQSNNLDSFFNPVNCSLYKINKDNTYTIVSTAPDVYDLLDKKISVKDSLGVLIYTTGWAAPLDDDGQVGQPPSQNPLKRRVALITCATKTGSGSALSFQDDPDIVTDPGTATGSLAQAITKFWNLNR